MDGPMNAFKSQSPFDPIQPLSQSRIKQVWTVGGGKGGIGKSMLSSSIAITLARQGFKVVAVDLDLGGANLHTALSIDLPQQTLNDFFSHRVDDLNSCSVPTAIPNLHIISGAQDAIGVADIAVDEKIRLLQKLRGIDADYLMLDLGAGTGNHTLDFFLFSDIQLVTLLPEPTSIENAYRFIKSAYFRRLRIAPDLAPIRGLIEKAMDSKNSEGIRSPSDLYRIVNREQPEMAMKLKKEIERFQPKLIVNQTRTQTDVDIGFSVKTVCKKYFGIDMEYVGYLDYDSSVWQSVRRKKPVLVEFPNSKMVSSIDRIVQQLLRRHGHLRSQP